MRKLILLLLVIITTLEVQAQRRRSQYEILTVGLGQGVTTSQLTADGRKGFHKYGMRGGIVLNSNVGGMMGFQVEANYVERGTRYWTNFYALEDSARLGPGYYVQLNYLEFPLLLQYKLDKLIGAPPGLILATGISYARLTNQKEVAAPPGENNILPRTFNKNEFSWHTGFSFVMASGFAITYRFSRSLFDGARIHPDTGEKQLNVTMSLMLSYQVSILN